MDDAVLEDGPIDWDLVQTSLGPLAEGLVKGTLPLTALSFVLGLALALVLALMRLSSNRFVSGLSRGYVSLIRGTPLLLQLFIIFFGLPSLGLTIDPFPSAVIAASHCPRGTARIAPRTASEA